MELEKDRVGKKVKEGLSRHRSRTEVILQKTESYTSDHSFISWSQGGNCKVRIKSFQIHCLLRNKSQKKDDE